MADKQSSPQPPQPDHLTPRRAIELLKTDVLAWNKWRVGKKKKELPELSNADLQGAHLEEANLRLAHLKNANLHTAILRRADLFETHLENANLSAAHLEGARLSHAHLEGANLRKAQLDGADLQKAQLEGTNLSGANLRDADLRGIQVDSSTTMRGSAARGCKIDRYTLELLGDDRGFSRPEKMEMDIEDGLARLRTSFSGYLQYLHLVAMAVFVFPYVSFVLRHWTAASFGLGDDDKTITLGVALLRYIVGSGAGWREGWSFSWAFLLFLFSFAYNFARACLLWKTKTLELVQEASGLPVKFSLTGNWHLLYQVTWIGLWVNAGVVLLHTVHFLSQRIPL